MITNKTTQYGHSDIYKDHRSGAPTLCITCKSVTTQVTMREGKSAGLIWDGVDQKLFCYFLENVTKYSNQLVGGGGGLHLCRFMSGAILSTNRVVSGRD